ncbi:hypothetical protein BsWGS_18674 [Bradybaena similaris]
MSDSSTILKLGTALVIFCLCDLVISDIAALSRQKRGFRQDAASRVAHGFGKRASFLHFGQLDNLPSYIDDASDGSEAAVNKLESLLARHPSLGRFLLNNYLTPYGDENLATSEERPSRVVMK